MPAEPATLHARRPRDTRPTSTPARRAWRRCPSASTTPCSPDPGTSSAPPTELRRNRDFLIVLFGQGISSFGDAISNTALPILVLALTGSGFAMGVVGVLTTLPDLIVGLPAGAYADRWDRRKMMLWSDLGRAVLTAMVPISVAIGGPTIAVILLVTFPLNVLRVLWLAAYTAAVPGLVGREQVPRASAIFEAVFNVGWIVGPALAGLLVRDHRTRARRSPSTPSRSASPPIALLFVRRPLRAEARAEPTHILEDVREGIRFVAHQPTLRAVLALWTTTSVVTAGFTAVLIYYITVDRGLGEAVVGLVLSAWALGSLFGLARRGAPRPQGGRRGDARRGGDLRDGDPVSRSGRRSRSWSPPRSSRGWSMRTSSSPTSPSGRCSRRTRCWAGSGRRPARSRSG